MNGTEPDRVSGRLSIGLVVGAFLGLAILVGLIAVLIANVDAIRDGIVTKPVVLPRGGRLQLLSVTYGKKVEFSTTNGLEGFLRRILPARFQHLLRPPVTISGGWLADSGPTGLRMILLNSAGPSNIPMDLVFETEDEAGFRYPTARSSMNMIMDWPTNRQWGYLLEPTAYPRRQKEFLLRVSTTGGSNVATFKIHNPESGPFPEWQPSAIPKTLTNGPVKLTLRALDDVVVRGQPLVVGEWKIESSEPAWDDARIRSVTLLDASSNFSAYTDVYTPNPTNAFATNWWATNWGNPPLSARETAWKVRALVERPNREDFESGELAVLINVPTPRLPTSNSPAEFASDASSNLTIQITHLGSGYMSNNEFYLASFYVDVKAKQFGPDDELHLTVRDDQGRDLRDDFDHPISSYSASLNLRENGQARLEVKPAPDAKYINLEFYASHALRFEFLVDPRNVRVAASATGR